MIYGWHVFYCLVFYQIFCNYYNQSLDILLDFKMFLEMFELLISIKKLETKLFGQSLID